MVPTPTPLRIRLKYADEQTFVEKFAPNVSRQGIFIVSKSPKPVGTPLRFELLLADGKSKLLKGEGLVVWVREFDAENPTRPHGMSVRFSRLDSDSRKLIERIELWKKEQGERGDENALPDLGPSTPPVESLATVSSPEPIEVPDAPEADLEAAPEPSSPPEVAPPPRAPAAPPLELPPFAPPRAEAEAVDVEALLGADGPALDDALARARTIAQKLGSDESWNDLDELLAPSAVEPVVMPARRPRLDPTALAAPPRIPAVVPVARPLAPMPIVSSVPPPRPSPALPTPAARVSMGVGPPSPAPAARVNAAVAAPPPTAVAAPAGALPAAPSPPRVAAAKPPFVPTSRATGTSPPRAPIPFPPPEPLPPTLDDKTVDYAIDFDLDALDKGLESLEDASALSAGPSPPSVFTSAPLPPRRAPPPPPLSRQPPPLPIAKAPPSPTAASPRVVAPGAAPNPPAPGPAPETPPGPEADIATLDIPVDVSGLEATARTSSEPAKPDKKGFFSKLFKK